MGHGWEENNVNFFVISYFPNHKMICLHHRESQTQALTFPRLAGTQRWLVKPGHAAGDAVLTKEITVPEMQIVIKMALICLD